MRVACCLVNDPDQARALAESLLIFSPQIAVTWEAVFLEISRCQGLYSEAEFLRRVEVLAKHLGYSLAIAIADDIPTSLAFARYQRSRKEDLPISALRDYLSPFSGNNSLDSMLALLQRLGLRNLGNFLHLSPAEISQRFGKVGILVHERVREAANLAWPRYEFPEQVQEVYALDVLEEIASIEPLLFVLKIVVDRALARLRGRGRQALVLELECEFFQQNREPQARRIFRFDFPLPQNQTSGILAVFQDRLRAEFERSPLTAPLKQLRLTVAEEAPFTEAQRDFFSSKDVEMEAWASLLARLQQRLGEENVFFAEAKARHLPEASWAPLVHLKKGSASLEEGTNPLGIFPLNRPLRIFPEPIPLEREGDSLRSQEKNWRIRQVDGPEYISGEWWWGGFAREYFRVETDVAEFLWIYRSENKIYLHGIFD